MTIEYELAQVVWNDAVVNSSWSGPSLTLATVHSVGYILDEDDNALCLAASVSGNGCFNSVMTIPKSCITERVSLTTATVVEDVVEVANDVVDGDGWINWNGGSSLDLGFTGTERILVKLRNGAELEGVVSSFCWSRFDGQLYDIIAYKVVKDVGVEVWSKITNIIGDTTGWQLHSGDECPVDESTAVEVITRDDINYGEYVKVVAPAWSWDWTQGDNNIIAYKVIKEGQ